MLPSTALALALTLAGAPENLEALRQSAKDAAAAERWCDAHAYFQRLHARTGELKHLYNAAEVARAAGDVVAALAAYRDVQRRAGADFPERARVARVIGELEQALAAGQLGSQCGIPDPVCGNGAIEATEACDDANDDEGDGCTSACTAAPVVERVVAPPPAPEVTPEEPPDEGAAPLVVAGGVIAGVGAVTALAFTTWALVLEAQLRAPAPDASRAEKDAALGMGWPVVFGAVTGGVVAGVGAALVVVGRE